MTFISLAMPSKVSANPLSSWSISCGADAGAITRKGNTWKFTRSANYCDNFFEQRSEISTQPISLSVKGAYLFSATVSMTTSSSERFSMWQIHDSRLGCAPPFQVYVEKSGQMLATSDVKIGPDEACIRGQIGELTNASIKRDGTKHELKVLVNFDGEGSFDVTLWLDGRAQIAGRYSAQIDKYRSKHFYFKMGVYSMKAFDYVFVAENIKVQKVKIQ